MLTQLEPSPIQHYGVSVMLSPWMELSHARYTIHSPPYCIEEVISFHETENVGNHQWISPQQYD